jgi:multidrug efflux pump subunit AcrA (membrane-fusion protein)
MSITLSNRRSLKAALPWVGVGVCVLLLAVNLLHDTLFHGRPSAASQAAAEKPPEPAAASQLTTVSLPEGKWKEAKIATEPARVSALTAEVGVPGRVDANLDRRVEIRPRASGVIREVRVALGQKVKKGDPLVVLDSPDVGTARLNLRSKQRELATARFEDDWKVQVAANVEQIVPELRKGVEAVVLQKKYAARPLGAFRAQLLQAYAEFDIASHEEEKTAGLHREMIIGEHPAFVARHTREGTQAKFEAALEQVRFDALQQKKVADQMVRDAEGAVIDAAQRLRILGVPYDIAALLSPSNAPRVTSVDEDITAYQIVAPRDGTIIAKSALAVASQKADMNDSLFTLADLSTVWVTANVPESDFDKLTAFRQGTIHLTAAAYPGRTFKATLLSTGSVVDQATRTVPLLAETPNPGDMLKLGMFVRIVLDTEIKEDALTVPSSAVVEIEGRPGVFVPSGDDGRTYTFRPIKPGREAGNRRVVLSGVQKGEPVVYSGAFILKSELILQNQTEDE